MPLPLAGGLAAWVVAALVGGFGQSIVQGLVKLLIALGFGFISYQGMGALMDFALNAIAVNLNSVHPVILGMLGYMKVDKALNVIASAYAARWAIQGLTSGIMTKFGVTAQ